MTLGLTGGYCAGKSTAARALASDGWTVIDVDALGHAALAASIDAVAALLGPGARKTDGSPDRRAIGALVFADPALLARYEAVVHPAMNALLDSALARAGERACVDAAILYRLPVACRCDAIIEVRAPLLARLARARSRDGLGARAALSRIARQRPLWRAGRAFAARRLVVANRGDPEALARAAVEAASRALTLNRAAGRTDTRKEASS